ncbi:hypothetical protein [Streptomyces sp. NPDC058374]|uniref:hypothetical protein n=1 Tax=Streptomyces sp. NPDC058374 TaxID=3346466 RepID=UPI00364F48EC
MVVLSLIRDELAMDASAGRAALLAERRPTVPVKDGLNRRPGCFVAERRPTVPVKDGLNRRPGWGSGAAPS